MPRLQRSYPRHPFVPDDEDEFGARAADILDIQATGLARRMLAANCEQLVIGLSGGLDSTLAFLVCLAALAKLSLPPAGLVALTMPGPGTTTQTNDNAHRLTRAAGVQMVEIPIHAAVDQHLEDLEHAQRGEVPVGKVKARHLLLRRLQLREPVRQRKVRALCGVGDGHIAQEAMQSEPISSDTMNAHAEAIALTRGRPRR